MISNCLNPCKLEKYGQLIEKAKSYEEWEELNYLIENICFDISQCKNNCNNNICEGLQTEYEPGYDYEYQKW